jgi:hypothetical protein
VPTGCIILGFIYIIAFMIDLPNYLNSKVVEKGDAFSNFRHVSQNKTKVAANIIFVFINPDNFKKCIFLNLKLLSDIVLFQFKLLYKTLPISYYIYMACYKQLTLPQGDQTPADVLVVHKPER